MPTGKNREPIFGFIIWQIHSFSFILRHFLQSSQEIRDGGDCVWFFLKLLGQLMATPSESWLKTLQGVVLSVSPSSANVIYWYNGSKACSERQTNQSEQVQIISKGLCSFSGTAEDPTKTLVFQISSSNNTSNFLKSVISVSTTLWQYYNLLSEKIEYFQSWLHENSDFGGNLWSSNLLFLKPVLLKVSVCLHTLKLERHNCTKPY